MSAAATDEVLSRHELYLLLLHGERYRLAALELERFPSPVESRRRRAVLSRMPLDDTEPT